MNIFRNAVKVGAIVKLKSGGPDMTVLAVADGEVRCTWFDGFDLKTAQFDLEVIKGQFVVSDDCDAISPYVDNFG